MAHELIFWMTATSIVLVIYHHVGYPLLLKMLVRLCRTSQEETSNEQNMAELPSITVLMPAYNEAQWVAEKLRNLAVLDYPQDKLEVVLACDGCTDNTAAIAKATAQEPLCAGLNLRVIEYVENHGKAIVINKAMATIKSDVVALSDISALISFDALMLAAAHFSAPDVGVVNSRYCLLKPGEGEQQYWDYQNKIRSNEAAIGSSLGAHGALYFIRRELFSPFEFDTINDDFILPMKIVEKGYRAVVQEEIRAVELEPTNTQQDFRRRLRIGAGNCQQLFRLSGCLNPRLGGVAFTFASSKGLRVVMPFLMLTALIGSALLAPENLFFAIAAGGQATLYGLVMLWSLTGYQPKSRLCRALAYLVAGHTANAIGTLRYITGFEKGRWQRV